METIRRTNVQWVLVLALLVSGCGLIEKHHLVGSYYLVAEDVPEQMKVIYNLQPGVHQSQPRIPETVYAVGWDCHYVVAMQHPKNDRSITNYYYLDISRDGEFVAQGDSVVGPLTAGEFRRKQAELGLPGFRRVIKSLE